MRMCRVIVLFVVFDMFGKLRTPFLMIWGSSSLILRPGKSSLLALEGVLSLGFAKLSSRDQVGC